MKSFQSKKNGIGLFKSKLFLFFLIVVLFFFSFKIFDFVGKAKIASKNREIAEDRLETLQKSKENLKDEINNLKTEKGIEENIREKFGFAKEGEHLIMIVEEENKNIEIEQSGSKGFWNIIKNWFE